MFRNFIYFASVILVLVLAPSAPGQIEYEYYEAPAGSQYTLLDHVEFGVATPLRTGTTNTLNAGDGNWIEQAGGHRADDFAFRFKGYIDIPVGGDVTFYLRSDDGSMLFIDGAMVIDNDGTHGAEGAPGDPNTINLTAGMHEFDVRQFERGGGDSLYVNWLHPGLAAWEPVPDSALFIKSASSPDPGNGEAKGPTVDGDNVYMLLDYDPGTGATEHRGYFSDVWADVNDRVPSAYLGTPTPWPSLRVSPTNLQGCRLYEARPTTGASMSGTARSSGPERSGALRSCLKRRGARRRQTARPSSPPIPI